MGLQEPDWWVDDRAHMLHHGERTFPCNRNIECLAVWEGCALLLSSDTDCLSLWDMDGPVRTLRIGVYPQDMAIADDLAIVCGGADCRLHLLTLPELRSSGEISLPGMPERIALQGSDAHVLALLTEPEVHTALLQVPLPAGPAQTRLTLPGIPGALAPDAAGLWIGVGERVLHLPHGELLPDVVIEGFEMPERIEVHAHGLRVTDALLGRTICLHFGADDNKKERSPCDERPCVCELRKPYSSHLLRSITR